MLISFISPEQKQLLSLYHPTADAIFSTDVSLNFRKATGVADVVYEFVILCLQATYAAFARVNNISVISQTNSRSWTSLSYLGCTFFQCIRDGTCICLAQCILRVCILVGI